MKAEVYLNLLNKILVQYKNSRNNIERAEFTSWHYDVDEFVNRQRSHYEWYFLISANFRQKSFIEWNLYILQSYYSNTTQQFLQSIKYCRLWSWEYENESRCSRVILNCILCLYRLVRAFNCYFFFRFNDSSFIKKARINNNIVSQLKILFDCTITNYVNEFEANY